MPLRRRDRSRTVVFDRGLRTIISDYDSQRGFTQLDNVWLDPDARGALSAMSGFVKVNSSAITGHPLRTVKTVKGNDGVILRFVCSTDRVVRVDAAGTVTDVKTGLTNADHVGIEVLKNFAIFFNKSDTPFKATIEASPTVSDMGVGRPDVSSVTVTPSPGGGAVRGTPKWFVAYMSGTVEGALSLPFQHYKSIGGAGAFTIVLGNLPLGPGGESVLYRTYEFGGQPFFVARLSGDDDGTTSYNDIAADSDLGDLPYLHGDPPESEFGSVVTYIDRVFALRGNRVYWTDQREPESWYVEAEDGNFLWVYRDDGDNGVTLMRDLDGILVFKSDRLYKIVGRTPAEFIVVEITFSDNGRRALGTPSQNSVVAVPGRGVAFYWNRRIWLYTGGVVRSISSEISDDLFSIRRQDEALGVALGYYARRDQLWVSLPMVSGNNPTHTYIYDFLAQQWIGRKTVGFRGYASIIDENGVEAFWGLSSSSPAEGFVYKLDSGVDHDGSAYSAVATLPPFFGSNPNDLKMFLKVEIHYVPQSSGSFDIEVIIDGKTSASNTTTVSQVQANTTRDKRTVNIGYGGREVVLKIKSNADQPLWQILAVTYTWIEEGVAVSA